MQSSFSTSWWLWGRRNLVREGWSGIDVQLKRRTDLIPNLIDTAKGYADHERSLFEDIVKLRNASMSAASVKSQENAERDLSGALSRLIALKEAYPDLKANQNFLKLQEQLAEIEDQLQMARRYYNGSVRNLNIDDLVISKRADRRTDGLQGGSILPGRSCHRVTPQVSFEKAAS